MTLPPSLVTAPELAVVGWLLTYAAHSTVVLGGVWLVSRRGPLSEPWPRSVLWRGAAVAGVLTATLQTTAELGRGEPAAADTARMALPGEAPTWIDDGTSEGERARLESLQVRLRARATDDGPVRQIRAVAASSRLEAPPGPGVPMERRALVEGTASTSCRAQLNMELRSLADAEAAGAPALGQDRSKGEVEKVLARCAEARAKWPWWVLAFWFAGVTASFLRVGAQNRSLQRALDPSWPAGGDPERLLRSLTDGTPLEPVRLFEAPGLGTPIALTRRRLYLPAHAPALMGEGELCAALAHELGHLARRDPAWLAGLRLLEAVFFFQPLNRLARNHFQEASEFLADRWAVDRTGRPLDLARSLEKVSSWVGPPAADAWVSTMARRESPVVERVRRLVSPSASAPPRGVGLAAALLFLPALLLPPVHLPRPPLLRVVVIQEVRTVGEPVPGGLAEEDSGAVWIPDGESAGTLHRVVEYVGS